MSERLLATRPLSGTRAYMITMGFRYLPYSQFNLSEGHDTPIIASVNAG